jgi:hypothetical protein
MPDATPAKADEEITILALTKTEMQRLRKIALDSDYGDAKPILARAQERGQGYVAMVKPSKGKS